MRKTSAWLWILFCVGVLPFASGCYSGGIDSYEETDTVVTVKNPEADFSANLTFTLPTEIIDLCEVDVSVPPVPGEQPDCSDDETIDHDYDDEIIDLVRTNLQNLGYVEETDPEANAPDVQMFVAAATNSWYVSYYYDYWYYYWGYPGGGWYYPGYPVVAVYDTGTLLITMVKFDDPDAAEPTGSVLWNGAINGLLGSNLATTQTRVENAINQAFSQSPYLSVK